VNDSRMEFIAWFADVGRGDLARVGGKNASLGELTRSLQRAGINVPAGFAVTASAYA
jgi:pyruvate,water dikinase